MVPMKCRDVGMWVGWGNCLLFLPYRQRIYPVFFMEIPFVSFYKIADSVMQQICNCPYKTQTATTGARPPLVASQYRPYVNVKVGLTFG